MSLTHLTFVVLFYLCGGFFVSLGFVTPSRVGRRYFLYHGLGTSALACLCLVCLSQEQTSLKLGLLGFIAACTIYALTASKHPKISWATYGLGIGFTLWCLIADLNQNTLSFEGGFQHFGYFLSNGVLSLLLLGFTMAAMLLGHWYLVQPKLPIEELGRLTWIMISLLGVRLILSTWGSVHLLGSKSELEIYTYLASNTAGIFLLMRWVWGLLGPLALCYFIWQTVKIRSTQSATGILYVAVVLVLAGETISQYLAFFHGIPL